MRIEEEYKKTGYFWLPEKEENKIPGILSIDDGGKIELEIVGHFDEGLKPLSGDDNLSRIIGHVEKDGLVTLDDCFYTKKNFSFGGISKSKVVVHKALSGAAWDKDEKVVFNTFSFSVDCLDEWVGISGIDVDNDWDRRTATIRYDPPEKIRMELKNGMTLEICFAYTLPGSPNLTEAKITQRAFFRLESENPRDLSDFTSIAFKITNLMCFAMDEIVSLKNVSATSSEMLRDGGNDKKYPVPISIYYQSIPFSEKIPKKTWHEMLFNFGAIKTNAQQMFNNWLNAYEYLSPALGLYFSTKAGAQKYLDGKFLALAQGLETYHRRTSSETLMDKDSYEVLVSEVLEGCPAEHLDWLKGRLMHGNEINLGKRIKKIIEPFKDHLGTSAERSKLLRKIVDTRNYLTHYSESLHDKSAKGRDLWVLCMKMEVIFNLHFLKVIGFADEEISRVVENCHPLKRKLKEI
ncbi:ApeA N-terminal domain 1-containing protein [Stutzerimonas nitrititolerans]|uniref:ApeA N-terminal domain 1-containing protein n=1 Tax=Stutzerimonas nitrititolerans TaxID=2482751 RepID=UPI0028990E44|nr:HEPN domain-containing protein [Stutzerimonas nitrititolerans]